MIDRKKFNDLSDEEKRILGDSIGFPDYEDDNELYDQLNHIWGMYIDDSNIYVEIVKKL